MLENRWLDLTTITWTSLSSDRAMPDPRTWFAASSVGMKFILFGGYAPLGIILDDTWLGSLSMMPNSAYDVVWSQAVVAGSSPNGRFNAAACESIGMFFLHGGQGSPTGDLKNPLLDDFWKVLYCMRDLNSNIVIIISIFCVVAPNHLSVCDNQLC